MTIPFECSYEKSLQAMVTGHFLYIIFRIDSPTTSNCGAHCWKQAGEEWIMPAKFRLAAFESGESAVVEGALHHVQAAALRFCVWKAEYVHLYRSGDSSKKRECLQHFHKPCSPQEPVQHPCPAPFSQQRSVETAQPEPAAAG